MSTCQPGTPFVRPLPTSPAAPPHPPPPPPPHHHERSHGDERGAGGVGWHGCQEGAEEECHEKAECDAEGGNAGARALADARSALNVHSERRGSQARADCGVDGGGWGEGCLQLGWRQRMLWQHERTPAQLAPRRPLARLISSQRSLEMEAPSTRNAVVWRGKRFCGGAVRCSGGRGRGWGEGRYGQDAASCPARLRRLSPRRGRVGL